MRYTRRSSHRPLHSSAPSSQIIGANFPGGRSVKTTSSAEGSESSRRSRSPSLRSFAATGGPGPSRSAPLSGLNSSRAWVPCRGSTAARDPGWRSTPRGAAMPRRRAGLKRGVRYAGLVATERPARQQSFVARFGFGLETGRSSWIGCLPYRPVWAGHEFWRLPQRNLALLPFSVTCPMSRNSRAPTDREISRRVACSKAALSRSHQYHPPPSGTPDTTKTVTGQLELREDRRCDRGEIRAPSSTVRATGEAQLVLCARFPGWSRAGVRVPERGQAVREANRDRAQCSRCESAHRKK